MTALAKANLSLALKLADVARVGGQESLQLGSRAVGGFAEEARSSLARTTGGDQGDSKPIAGKAASLLSEAETIREHIVGQTRAALEEWQKAWSDTLVFPGTTGGDALAGLFKPWFGIAPGTGIAPSNATPTAKGADAKP
ncbi:hypothetical protein [Sphingomonas oryzagri]